MDRIIVEFLLPGMPKLEIRKEGQVMEALPGTTFRVKLDENGREMLAHLSGKLRINHIRILPGDRVVLELPEENAPRGRIVYRR